MKISDHFQLNKTQAELDFVNIDIHKDTPLFIDPFFLNLRQDKWSIEASRTVRSFFQFILELIRKNKVAQAKHQFTHLHEPNSTCLGLSKGKPRGRGIGRDNTDDIFDSIIQSKAVQTGLIRDIEDNFLFVDGFGKDKLSDMTTNIIRKHLINYTVDQCVLHGIALRQNVPSGFYWNGQNCQWESEYCEMLIIDNTKILLVPKSIVSFCKDYTPDNYYQHFVLNFLQNEHLQMNSVFVKNRKSGKRYVTKKDLKEEHPLSKEFLREFTRKHPEILEKFKKSTKTYPLRNLDIADVNLYELVNYLIEQLANIPAGAKSATHYHVLVLGILELLFYPHLIYPVKEKEIHQGRKRIDITFDNAAESGIFARLSQNMNIPCQYIMIECKNYSSDPHNPELDQLAGRFSTNRGKVGILLCRTIDNIPLFLDRCRDTFKDDRGLIIPLVDLDIIELLKSVQTLHYNYSDRFLSNRIRNIAIH